MQISAAKQFSQAVSRSPAVAQPDLDRTNWYYQCLPGYCFVDCSIMHCLRSSAPQQMEIAWNIAILHFEFLQVLAPTTWDGD